MKTRFFLLFLAVSSLFSCSKKEHKLFDELDRAIVSQEYFDMKYSITKDSLALVFRSAENDSCKWEAAYKLGTMLFYHNVDSCHHYVREMMKYGTDTRQKNISKASYANILDRMDSLKLARNILESIDTAFLTEESRNLYCNVGYHIYSNLATSDPEYLAEKKRIIDYWWQNDSTNMQCVFYHANMLRKEGKEVNAIERLKSCHLATPNDTTRLYYFLANEYLQRGDTEMAIKYLTRSAAYDMRLSVKAYNALYQLAIILFREGEIERADRYMRITLKDAQSARYRSRYEDVIHTEMEIMNALLLEKNRKNKAYFITAVSIALMLIVAVILLFLLSKYSKRLHISREKLSEVSKIKDSFLAIYMEKCVDYLNKVDKYRSSLRQAVKQDGPDAAIKMLRQPSFTDGEFQELLIGFDSAFLGIFPDFVDKVNEHMQEEHRLTMPSKGELSTELRILALIRMGISKRVKIAKVLNLSVATVYSYHCSLRKNSIHRDSSFDKIIANL